ncbi:hypothetical protein CWS02_14730 [Enterobacter sp. EA-1]|nr:hypothetical protein CWS02_14730 [Enterobacter sp. EA-1]
MRGIGGIAVLLRDVKLPEIGVREHLRVIDVRGVLIEQETFRNAIVFCRKCWQMTVTSTESYQSQLKCDCVLS